MVADWNKKAVLLYLIVKCLTFITQTLPQTFAAMKHAVQHMLNKPVSLKDIAAELGVSISTVSRALRNVGEISPETRKKISDYAQKMLYRPNPHATGLLKSKTFTVGVIVPEIESNFYSAILRGIDAVAIQNGYRVITSFTNESYATEVLAINEMRYFRVDGIIACPALEAADYQHFTDLVESRMPVCFFERDWEGIPIPHVATDNYRAAFQVTSHLIEQGCRRIAFITNLEMLSTGRHRYEGYINALSRYSLPINQELVIHGTMNISTSVEAARHLLSFDHRPDAVICHNDLVAMAVMKEIKDAGLQIPQDIAVAGFTNDVYSEFLTPGLTTIKQPLAEIGQNCMRIILDMIEGKPSMSGSYKMTLPSTLVIRASTMRSH